MNFPKNVKGLDWSQPPMESPPSSRTYVGYACWCDNCDGEELVDCKKEFYVLPDGGAEIVSTRGVRVEKETLAPGTWEPEYPATSFGSHGGIWIRGKR